ncbi:hypothetical protein JJB09_17500 [Rhizobium sp. KVB221]|uniref:Site-2 protease family protein n=1 Tax=Rhizobium setariae TaxID=2801340 RepID=A0A937CNJ7_9HYPH|nr:hypothetical protein [Rhizobium setariae]MBL0373821.1 hypothetical protein [Rhizobium setariae]
MTSIMLAAFAIILALIFILLLQAGKGGRIISISRRSAADPESSWGNLQSAWLGNGLTFKPSHLVASEDEEGSHRLTTSSNGAVDEFSLKLWPQPSPCSIAFSVTSKNGRPSPNGERHFEHWSVEPDGAGSKITVQTRFEQGFAHTVTTLLRLWRNVGILASPKAEIALETVNTSGSAPPKQGTKPHPARPRRPSPTNLPSHYGREAAISLIAFGYLLTQYKWQSAVVLALVILWHEYGHLLAYRLTGKTGNRLMLVPFFGGIAVAGAPHKSEFEKAFCALMGPGICAPLTLGAFALWYYDVAPDYDDWFWLFIHFSSVLNLLNLLPIYPLDGGQTAESFLRSFLPSSILVHLSGLSVAGLVVLLGYEYYEMAVFVGLFSLMGLRTLPSHSPMAPMSKPQALIIAIFYAAIVAAHGGVFYYVS